MSDQVMSPAAFEAHLERKMRAAKTLKEMASILEELLDSPYEYGPDGHLIEPPTAHA
jgi:hypothetical protein